MPVVVVVVIALSPLSRFYNLQTCENVKEIKWSLTEWELHRTITSAGSFQEIIFRDIKKKKKTQIVFTNGER